jgi:hypothetical protein
VGRQPPTVAPGCAEAGELRLEDDDVERGTMVRQPEGRPETGESAADDADVAVEVTVEG